MTQTNVRRAAPVARNAAAALLGVLALGGWGTCALAAAPAPDQTSSAGAQQGDLYNDGAIHAWRIQGNVWLLAGEPGASNVVIQVGSEGVLVVDSGVREQAAKLLERINAVAAEHAGEHGVIRQLINTSSEADHIGGNEVVRKAGQMIVAGNFARDNLGLPMGADVIASENTLAHLVADNAAGRAGAEQSLWPQDTVGTDVYNSAFNDEAVQLLHPHQASTDGDEMVLFRRSDVLVTGDVVSMQTYPLIDTAHGGTIDGELVALNRILDIAVPVQRAEGGTLIVPGHGRLCDQSDIVNYKNILTVIRNRVQYYKNQGKTLAQVLALKPSADFDGRWAGKSGPTSAEGFVTAIYRTLPAKGPSFSMRTTTLVPATAGISGGQAY